MGREGAAVEENRVNSWGTWNCLLAHIHEKPGVCPYPSGSSAGCQEKDGETGEIRTIFPGERLT